MNFEHHWNTHRVPQDEYLFLDKPGLLYTENLGPCIGICLAYGGWAGIMHSSHPPHDEKEIGELIAEAKRVIPPEKIAQIRPILCGSDPDAGNDDEPDLYEQARIEAREKAEDILRTAGFGTPHVHWSSAQETAAVFADTDSFKIFVEVDEKEFEYPILQGTAATS